MAFVRPRVVVRFREGLQLSDRSDLGEQIEEIGVGPWKTLELEFPGLTLNPVFTHLKRVDIQELSQRAMETDPTYKPAEFGAFYYLDAPPNTDLIALVKTLLRWRSVQEAYIDQTGPDPVVNAADDPRSANQGYLDPAPDGIDAEYAWTFAGGDGAGQRWIDLERGWTLDHEDISAHGASLLHGTLLDSSRAHGTSVLGEVCAVDNTVGCVGIVPNIASVDVVSYNGSTLPDAILAAIASLNFGDVLLLEAQVWLNGTNLLGPIEAYDAEYEAIRLATALGIIVVEAGGNGTNNGSVPPLDVDTYTTLSGRAILNRDPANPDFRDSGAIIVTAATSTAPHTRLAYGPHGRRIDCFAWGQNINTLSSNAAGSTTAYSTTFGGTSGASPATNVEATVFWSPVATLVTPDLWTLVGTDMARYMALEFICKLPESAKAMVEVPLGLYELLHEHHQLAKVSIDRKRAVAVIPVNPHGRVRFGEVLFTARSRMALRLLVQIPERRRTETYQIAVRQIWEREEVGRVTWQLQPKQTAKLKQ